MADPSDERPPTGASRPLVEVLITPDCPHRDAAIALTRQVCDQHGGKAEVRVVQVADQPAAERLRFAGSPTIRVDGRDIEPGAEWNVEVVYGCRLYQGPHSLHGLPEVAWLRHALQEAQARPLPDHHRRQHPLGLSDGRHVSSRSCLWSSAAWHSCWWPPASTSLAPGQHRRG